MAAKKFVLALDQGTTSSRSILFDAAGRIVQVAQKEFRQIYPRAGWVEHDPMEIWASQRATLTEVMAQAGIEQDDVAAIGITNQRETVVLWDAETGRPVGNAIVWQDRRTSALCEVIRGEGHEEDIVGKTGMRLDPYFSGTKVRWLMENIPLAQELADEERLRFGTVDSWLIWKLTRGLVHVTDATNASRTLFHDLESGDWCPELMKIFRVKRSMLPKIVDSSGVVGEWEGIPIAGIAGDQQAALFGQGCFEPGMAKNTYGTGCFMLMQTGDEPVRSRNNLLTTVAWQIGGKRKYALEGSIFIAGALVQWLRDELELVRSAEELNEVAARVEDSNGCVVVPAFAGLGAPYWDPNARGAVFGLTRGTSKSHLCRAALEAVALQSKELLDCMRKDSGLDLEVMRVDGGASNSDLLMQIQADLLQSEVIRPSMVETTALGAALLAGLAVGFWEDAGEVVGGSQSDTVFSPQKESSYSDSMLAAWKEAVGRVRSDFGTHEGREGHGG